MPKKESLHRIIRWSAVVLVILGKFLVTSNIWSALILGLGWIIGYFLAELDHVFYAFVCNPHELTCQRIQSHISQKNWKSSWILLQETAGERTNLAIHNVVTGLILAILGIWVVSSSGSLLASGAVLGLGIRLLTQLIWEADYQRWYWIFAKKFSHVENRIVQIVWALLLFVQLSSLIRR